MDAFCDRIKQYAAKEQAELRVRIKVPGSWFNNLTPTEARRTYDVEAFDWVAAHRFPKTKNGRAAQVCVGIKFLCADDVTELLRQRLSSQIKPAAIPMLLRRQRIRWDTSSACVCLSLCVSFQVCFTPYPFHLTAAP